jgi:hypothetical protein
MLLTDGSFCVLSLLFIVPYKDPEYLGVPDPAKCPHVCVPDDGGSIFKNVFIYKIFNKSEYTIDKIHNK